MSRPLLAVLCPAPTPSGRARAFPGGPLQFPRWTVPAFHLLYAGGFFAAAFSSSSPLPWPSPVLAWLGSPLSRPLGPGSLTARQSSLDATDRRFARLPYRRLCQRAPTAGFRPTSPLSYSAAGSLPRPDFHRQAQRGLSGHTENARLRHPRQCITRADTVEARETVREDTSRAWPASTCPWHPQAWRSRAFSRFSKT